MTDRRYTTRPARTAARREARPGPTRGVVGPGQAGQRLDAWLRVALAPGFGELSKADVRRVIVSGSVRLNGDVTRAAGRPLAAGDVVEARVDASRLHRAGAAGITGATTAPVVIFEDDWLIAVDKPAGLPTVPTADPRRDSLVRRVERWLAERTRDGPDREGAAVRLGVHQRLDAATSGVVLFTKSREADGPLSRAFERHEVEKVYLALTARPRGGRVAARLEGSVEAEGVRARRTRAAVTGVRVRRDLGVALLVEARPRTGRKHQVRIHLARAGAPLLGDARYGGPAVAGGLAAARVMLHAWRLSLAHPVTGAPLVLESTVPADFDALLTGLAAADRSPADRPVPGRG